MLNLIRKACSDWFFLRQACWVDWFWLDVVLVRCFKEIRFFIPLLPAAAAKVTLHKSCGELRRVEYSEEGADGGNVWLYYSWDGFIVWNLSQIWNGRKRCWTKNWKYFLTSKLCLCATETLFYSENFSVLKFSNFAGWNWKLFFGLKTAPLSTYSRLRVVSYLY